MTHGDDSVLDRSDLEVVDILSDLGVDHRVAKVIAFLSQVPEGKSREIERGCHLRQPEVSVATKELRERGWVTADERKGGGKGRPVHFYRLNRSLSEIVDVIEEEKREEVESEFRKIERLKSLVLP